jgi:hypothetical protein
MGVLAAHEAYARRATNRGGGEGIGETGALLHQEGLYVVHSARGLFVLVVGEYEQYVGLLGNFLGEGPSLRRYHYGEQTQHDSCE